MPPSALPDLTIGRLARAAGVGIETVRHYERLGLVAAPAGQSGYRRYDAATVGRIRFVKRAQELGFSLAEAGSLLRLEDGADRAAIRGIAATHLAQIETKLADLERMRLALAHALDACRHSDMGKPCPIIECIAAPGRAAPEAPPGKTLSARDKQRPRRARGGLAAPHGVHA
jgi:MerR family mercuric resistance operon transcriptional regulator